MCERERERTREREKEIERGKENERGQGTCFAQTHASRTLSEARSAASAPSPPPGDSSPLHICQTETAEGWRGLGPQLGREKGGREKERGKMGKGRNMRERRGEERDLRTSGVREKRKREREREKEIKRVREQEVARERERLRKRERERREKDEIK